MEKATKSDRGSSERPGKGAALWLRLRAATRMTALAAIPVVTLALVALYLGLADLAPRAEATGPLVTFLVLFVAVSLGGLWISFERLVGTRLGHLAQALEHVMRSSGDSEGPEALEGYVEPDWNPVRAAYAKLGAQANRVEDTRAEEDQLRARITELESQLGSTSSFFASLSHEIRTPLNAIIGVTDLLRDINFNDEDFQRYLEIQKRSSDILLILINDILDYSKIESGGMELEALPFDLRDTVESCVKIASPKAQEKGLAVHTHFSDEIPYSLMGDPTRLTQVLLNLLSNATKFTTEGSITVEVGPVAGKENYVAFRVTDTGIGIPQDKQEMIFEKFTQSEASTTRKFGGTGLGLSISKRLVEMMDGKIWVESEVDRGSSFCFHANLPQTERSAQQQSGRPDAGQVSKRLLIIEDELEIHEYFRELLSMLEIELFFENDGEAAAKWLETEEVDAILVDIFMPGKSGIEFVNWMIKSGRDYPVIFVSGNIDNNVLNALEINYFEVFEKPIEDVEHFLNKVEGALDKGHAKRLERQRVRESLSDRKLRILVVEDSMDNQFLLRAYFKKTPYEISFAGDGKAAFDAFKEGSFDIVLMDMQMPVMDGFEATQAIRNWEAEQQAEPTPVIGLSANSFADDIRASMDAGCDGYLVKPIKKTTLFETIKKFA